MWAAIGVCVFALIGFYVWLYLVYSNAQKELDSLLRSLKKIEDRIDILEYYIGLPGVICEEETPSDQD